MVDRDNEVSDGDERPLSMKLVKPKKRPARKKEPVGVGAGGEETAPEDEGEGSGEETPGNGNSPERSQ